MLTWTSVLDTTICDQVCQWLVTGQCFFPMYSGFLHQLNWLPWYNWNIVENGVKTPYQYPHHLNQRSIRGIVVTLHWTSVSVSFSQTTGEIVTKLSRNFTLLAVNILFYDVCLSRNFTRLLCQYFFICMWNWMPTA